MRKDEALDKFVNRLFDDMAKGDYPIRKSEDYLDASYAEMLSCEQAEYDRERLEEIEFDKKVFLNNEYDIETLQNWCSDIAIDLFESGCTSQDTGDIMEAACSVTFSFVTYYERESVKKCMSLAYDFIRKELLNLRKEHNSTRSRR